MTGHPATWRRKTFAELRFLRSDARVPTRGAYTRPEAPGVYVLYEDSERLGIAHQVYETVELTAGGAMEVFEVFFDSDRARREDVAHAA